MCNTVGMQSKLFFKNKQIWTTGPSSLKPSGPKRPASPAPSAADDDDSSDGDDKSKQ